MLVISFDAVGDDEFERLKNYPAIGSFIKQAAVTREVETVFVSNTYPAHTSVVTGKTPGEHGLISNTEPFPSENPAWNTREDLIKQKTVWQTAREKGIETAAVFWPVTAYSKSIRWNMPEVLARPGKSQLLTSLKAGSALMQLILFLRHRKLFDGVNQPALDNFATACMVDILMKKKPGLALIHLTAFDTLCHKYGKGSPELSAAFEALDRNLAALLNAAGEKRDVLIFSDHSQVNVHTVVTVNGLLKEMNLFGQECFFECCGGSAFLRAEKLPPDKISEIKTRLENSDGFRRFLTEGEMRESGYFGNAVLGITASAGFCYEAYAKKEKATHGYAPDTPGYKVFYMTRGFGLAPGERRGGSLPDIAELVTKRL